MIKNIYFNFIYYKEDFVCICVVVSLFEVVIDISSRGYYDDFIRDR